MLEDKFWENSSANEIKTPALQRRMKEFVKNFTGGDILKVMKKYESKMKLKQPVMIRLMRLVNAMEDVISGNQVASREVSHIYTNILACVVSEGKGQSHLNHNDFKEAGWKFKKTRYGTALKRQLDDSFTDLTPAKRGRHEISDELKKRIEKVWIENARPSASKDVTNPKNRSDKRPLYRLQIPAVHVMLNCNFVRTSINPEGEVSTTTFSKYRP